MAAGGTSRSLRSRTISLEGMAGEGEPANQSSGAPGASDAATTRNAAPSNPAPAAASNPVFVERARLRDQARKGKGPVRRSAAEVVENLQSATIGASQAVNELWPNLLRDSDVFRYDVVPDTEDQYDSQLPSPTEADFDQLAEDGNDKFISDSDETEEIQNINEGSQPAAPGPFETQPPAEDLSSDSEDFMDGEAPYHIAVAVAAQGGGPAPGRQLVHKEHVAKLVTVYQKAMQTFTKSKKGVAPSQLIPNKVWQQIYREYKLEFPTSSFKEDSLKDHLRSSLKDLTKQKDSPVDCEEIDDPAADEELMTRLMATDSWKARNVLKTRMDCMDSLTGQKDGQRTKSSTPAGSSTSGQTSSVAPPKAASGGGAAAAHVAFKPPTKSQNLKDARQDMAAMLGEFKSMSENRREDSSRKRKLADGKAALHEAKRQESEERRKMAKINLIKEQKALGLISEDEFLEKCRTVFQL